MLTEGYESSKIRIAKQPCLQAGVVEQVPLSILQRRSLLFAGHQTAFHL